MKSINKIVLGVLSMAAIATTTTVYAQVKVGDNPTAINANAALEIESTNKGFLLPRVALTATTNASPLTGHVAGIEVYNTASAGDVEPGVYYNDGTKWVRAAQEAEKTQFYGSGAPTGSCTSGTMYVDTLESSPTNGQTWTCSSGNWVSYTPPATTPFYLGAGTSDAGGNKDLVIYRKGGIAITPINNPSLFVNGTGTIDGIFLRSNGRIISQATAVENVTLTKKHKTGNRNFIAFRVNGVGVGNVIVSATDNTIAYNTSSDARLKENAVATHFSLNDLMKIEVKDYNYIADSSKGRSTGFIAQELYKIYPNAVTVGGEDVNENPWSVDYGKLTPLLVKAVQDQQKEIEDQKQEINDLRFALNEKLAQLEARVSKKETKVARKAAKQKKAGSEKLALR